MAGAGVFFHPDEELQHVYTKTVSTYDLSHLAFPVRLLGHLWPQGLPFKGSTEFLVLDINGVPRRLVCKIRRTANGGYPQPEVSGMAWKQFIEQKQVRVGDELVFYLPPPPPPAAAPPHEAPVFVISFMRRIRLLGTPIHAHIKL